MTKNAIILWSKSFQLLSSIVFVILTIRVQTTETSNVDSTTITPSLMHLLGSGELVLDEEGESDGGKSIAFLRLGRSSGEVGGLQEQHTIIKRSNDLQDDEESINLDGGITADEKNNVDSPKDLFERELRENNDAVIGLANAKFDNTMPFLSHRIFGNDLIFGKKRNNNNFSLRPMKKSSNNFELRPMKRQGNNWMSKTRVTRAGEENSFSFRPMRRSSNSFDLRPMKRGSFELRPMKRGSFELRPMKRGSFELRPMKRANDNFSLRPMKKSSFSLRPMKKSGDSFGLRPMKRNYYREWRPLDEFQDLEDFEGLQALVKRAANTFALRPMRRRRVDDFPLIRTTKQSDASFALRPMK